MEEGIFHFKSFSIVQRKAPMKVGTDGVLLGAWTDTSENPLRILDIGAGTGLLGLMMAQKYPAAEIDAIELHPEAFEECVQNFENSVWSDRLFCYHGDFKDFSLEMDEAYDLILSNPPFYTEVMGSGNPGRDLARQSLALPAEVLSEGVNKLLAPQGVFCVIIPEKEADRFFNICGQFNLFPQRITRVRGHQNAPIKRILIAFGHKVVEPKKVELTIEIDRHRYTEEYINLTRDFYLKM